MINMYYKASNFTLVKNLLVQRPFTRVCFSKGARVFVDFVLVPGDGRDVYCCSDSEAFPFWEPPSSHLFFSSLTSMPPDCQ